MYNLILKDILIQKRMIMLSLIYGVFFTLVFKNNIGKEGAVVAGTVALAYFFMINACGYEDKYNGFTIFTSLPVRKRDIVVSKYLSIFVFALIGIVLMSLIQILLSLAGVLDGLSPLSIETITGAAVSAALFGALYYPFYFKVGYMKSKFIVFILFMIIGFLPGILMKLLDRDSTMERMHQIISRLDTLPDLAVGGAILGAALLILFISMLFSIRIFEAKEL